MHPHFFRQFCPVRWTLLCQLIACGMIGAAPASEMGGERLYVDLRAKPDASALTAFDVNLIRPDAEVDLEAGHASGNRFIARLGKLTSAGCSNAVNAAARRGFNGFLFRVNESSDADAQITTIRAASSAFPDKQILLEGDFWHVQSVWPEIDGVFVAGVFQSLDNKADRAMPLHPRDSLPLQAALVAARRAGLATYVMDFGSRSDSQQIAETVKSIEDLGAVAFVTDSVEGGSILGPWRELDREIVVLHGWNPKNCAGTPSQPERTLTARRFHAPLEWLGYRMRYVDVGREPLPVDLDRIAGVVLDDSLLLTRREQAELASWIPNVIWEKVPLLMTGQPWSDSEVFDALRDTLRLGGSGAKVPGLKRVSVRALDSRFSREGSSAQPSATGFVDLEAPDGSEVMLSVRGESGISTLRFDQAFLTTWGGVFLDAGGMMDERAFLTRWIGDRRIMPVPDTTTRDGRRLLMIQTRSEGFSSTVSMAGLPTCGELMKKQILDRYLLPFTVGLCEAELRGWLPGGDPRDAPRFEQTARQIFSLPQVEPASATFTRPMAFAADASGDSALNSHATDDRRGFEREIAGSLAHLHRTVLPRGKPLGYVQWPAGADVSAEAGAFARRMGAAGLVEEPGVNGTRTFVSGEGVTRICREVRGIDDAVTKFRESAGTPRLTPLALQFSFEDAADPDRFATLEKRLDLCASLPLQPIGSADAGLPDMRRCRGVTGFNVRDGDIYVHTLGRSSAEIVLSPAGGLREHLRLEESGAPVRFHLLSSREAEFEFEDLRSGDVVFAGMLPESVCHIRVNKQRWSVFADADGRVRIDLPPNGYASLRVSPPAYAASR